MAAAFFICPKCKKIIEVIQKSACPTMCCGGEMQELKANTSDGALEKHVPAVTVAGNVVSVQVGSVEHPMADDHWIQWIWLESKQGLQRKALNPGDKPVVSFALAEGDAPLAVYEYCNKHGLWKKDLA